MLATGVVMGLIGAWAISTRHLLAVSAWALVLVVLIGSPLDDMLNKKFVWLYLIALALLFALDRVPARSTSRSTAPPNSRFPTDRQHV